MGEAPSKFDEPLQPQPIWVVGAKFCQTHEVTLRLREKFFSLSGDDFEIVDADTGVTWFRCCGKTFSLRDKKTIVDNVGNPVLNIRQSLVHVAPSFRVYAGDGDEQQLFVLDSHLTLVKAKAEAALTNGADGRPATIVCKGNFRSKQACIYMGEPKEGGLPIGKIHRPTSMRTVALESQDYYLSAAANVDLAMLVAVCICLDEMKKD